MTGDKELAKMALEAERKMLAATQDSSSPLRSRDIDWDVGMTLVKRAEESFPMERVTEEQMESVAARTVSETLSKFAAHSRTLQSLVDLGVDISKWERAGLSSRYSESVLELKAWHYHMAISINRRVLAFDFDRDIAPVLRFLVDIGVGARHLAQVATNAPMLFQHSVQVRNQ